MFVTNLGFSVLILQLFFNRIDAKWFDSLNSLKSTVPEEEQVQAVQDLLKRLLPLESQRNQFFITINSYIENGTEPVIMVISGYHRFILVSASSGVEAAYGIHRYLQTCCNVHISWDGNQLNLPDHLPPPNRTMKIRSVGRLRYYANVCTFSYSYLWWDWTQWERHLDWMALNGINLPLASVGQELIWRRVFLKFGLSEESVDNFLTGPAFLAWHRMGNLKAWAGPLSKSWHDKRLQLQQKILTRMVNLGMTPVLPAFAGHVPDEMKKLYPKASISSLPTWNYFDCNNSCVHFVEPADPLFLKIASAFMTEMNQTIGLYHAYSADPFNEMTPKTFDPIYIQSVGKSIYNGMAAVDPNAIWVMQAWMFVGTEEWRQESVAKALATSVPIGNLLFLDLYSEQYPIYPVVKSYFGQPFIWCMLHNFGGKLGMYGTAEKVNQGLSKAVQYPDSTLVGTGLTMEGINQNYPIYNLALDLFWTEKGWPINQTEWVESMSFKRYGRKEETVASAWKLLWSSVYNYTGEYTVECYEIDLENNYLTKFELNCRLRHTSKKLQYPRSMKDIVHYESSLLTSRPSLLFERQLWYDPRHVCRAWKYFIHESEKFKNSSLFRRDLVDLSRQVLNIVAGFYYQVMMNAYRLNQTDRVETFGNKLVQTLTDLDTILNSDEHFLLGKWIEDAKSWANSDAEKIQFDFNAKNQITLWGPNGEVADYARKQWAGLMEDYYKPRWSLFVAHLLESLTSGIQFDEKKFKTEVFRLVEKPFGEARTLYPTGSTGDSIKIAKQMYKIYINDCKALKMEI